MSAIDPKKKTALQALTLVVVMGRWHGHLCHFMTGSAA